MPGPVTVNASGDWASADYLGGGKDNNYYTFDATGDAGSNTVKLDGGNGSDQDHLTLKLTQSQYAAFIEELNAMKQGVGNVHIADAATGRLEGLGTLFGDGKGAITLDSLPGLTLANWDKLYVDVIPDPVPCVIGNVEENSGFTGLAVTDWVIDTLPSWNNTGSNGDGKVEVWGAQGLLDRTNSDLTTASGQAMETDAWGEVHGVFTPDVIETVVPLADGKQYTVSFDYASRSDGTGTDAFEVFYNGVSQGQFDPDQSSVGWNLAAFDVVGTAGVETIEIKELGANDAYGALIANFQVIGCMSAVEEPFVPVPISPVVDDIAIK